MRTIEMTIENIEKYMDVDSPKFPILCNGMLYEKEDCDEEFLALYEGKFMLNWDGGIYLSDGVYIYPNGNLGEE